MQHKKQADIKSKINWKTVEKTQGRMKKKQSKSVKIDEESC